jgi:hypothetical protein
MEFKFENILLPDSIVNESMSHGFVHYRIKPMTNLIAGNRITNNAAIYFDFNFPVLTNEAETRIVLSTNVNGISDHKSQFAVFPNPSAGKLKIESNELKIDKVEVYNMFGEKIHSVDPIIKEESIDIDLASQQPGIYFLQIKGNKGATTTTRIIKL